ncbi:hypothetical protein Pmani_022771 [Petrolisthes manimaculis]|uniref:G-protein coupled receptors family 1 profile domain-containing protein n=1 Tax=Petrolisthes manimaculis TaxID=1843537 RepID=A0AAE1U440_9EUCA|nr:hypothetical protein Pmani_022771 [Petrolisthes manimaculis]
MFWQAPGNTDESLLIIHRTSFTRQMACLKEGVSSIIIHVLILCCIVVSVCHQAAIDGEHFNTNEDSGRLEVSIGSEEGREEEGSEKGRVDILWTKHSWLGERRRRERMAGPDDERKLFTGHVPNITLIEITDEMEDGTENVTAESGRDTEEMNTTKSVGDAEKRPNRFVGCNYTELKEDSVMDKESGGRTHSQDTPTGNYRYAEFEDNELTTQSQVELIREKSINNNINGSTLHMLMMTHLPKECRNNLSVKRHLWFTPHSSLGRSVISLSPQCLKYSLDAKQIMKAGFNPFEGMYMYDYEEYPESVLNLQRELLKISYHAYVTGNEKCYNDIHNKKFFKVQNINVQAVGPIPSNVAESSCFSSLPRATKNAMLFYPKHDDLEKVTINKFWPTCLYNMMMLMYIENATFVTDWWYLSSSCKRNEIMLLVSSIVVTFITLAGNIFVLTVMVTSGFLHDTTFMIRASLASADLLMGLIPASLAVYDQFGLINGRLTLQNLNEDILLTNIPYIIASQSPGFQQLRFQRNDLMPILACFSFNVSTMVSLLTLAILSLERLCVMRGRPLSRTFMVKSIILSWTAGLLLSFLVNWRKEGIYFTGYFDPITKLTLNIGANAPSVSRWVFYLELCVMGLAGTTVIVCGTATLILYVSHHRLTRAVLNIHSCNRDSELRRTTIIFVLMVVMFTVTVGLVLVDICADLAVTKPLVHWLCWWGFVAASSWNWALYTLSGGRFREQIRSSLSCRRVQCLQKQPPSSPPHCAQQQQQQHISYGSNMFGVMFGREKTLQVELKSFSKTLNDININK